jgi:hypothetical protein
VAIALPKTEHRITPALVQFVQQCLVEGEILGRGGQGQIKQAESAHIVTAWMCRNAWVARGTIQPPP